MFVDKSSGLDRKTLSGGTAGQRLSMSAGAISGEARVLKSASNFPSLLYLARNAAFESFY